jgi:hypothetical protein
MRGPHARSGAGAPVVGGGKQKHKRRTKSRRNTGLSAYGATQSQANLSTRVFYVYQTMKVRIFNL